MTNVRTWFVLLLGASWFFASTSFAQDTDDADTRARQAFEAGTEHYEAGRFEQAITEFQRSYRISGRIELLYNIYLALRDNGQLEEARDALREFVERRELPPDAPQSRRLAALERRLAEGGGADTETDAPADESNVDTQAHLNMADTPAGGGSRSGGDSGLLIPGIIVVAVGGAALIAGAALVGVAFADESAIENATGTPMWSADTAAAADRVPTLAGAGYAMLGVGVAAAVAGIVMMVIDPGGGDSAATLRDGRVEVRF